MGSKYKTKCRSCNYQFELSKGGGWTWYQKICSDCGKELRVPRNAPLGAEVGIALTNLDLAKHLSDSTKWSRRGGKFEKFEIDMLNEMTSTCACGGDMICEMNPNIIYRCPSCKSSDLQLGDYVLFD